MNNEILIELFYSIIGWIVLEFVFCYFTGRAFAPMHAVGGCTIFFMARRLWKAK